MRFFLIERIILRCTAGLQPQIAAPAVEIPVAIRGELRYDVQNKHICMKFPHVLEAPMSLKKYEVFAKTVELGSLTRAAEALGSTQSRISHVLAELEAEFGFSLLRRSRSGVSLTEGGHLVLPKIQEILRENQALSQLAAEIRCADAGTVRLGAFTSVAVHWLPGIIQTFQAAHPKVSLELLSGDYYDMEQWLRKGSVDLGFVTLPAPAGFEAVPLCDDELLAVLPLHHPLAAADEQLGGKPLLQLFNRFGQRRLRDRQRPAGATYTAFPGYFDEGANLMKFNLKCHAFSDNRCLSDRRK